jgi:hypothetical protein
MLEMPVVVTHTGAGLFDQRGRADIAWGVNGHEPADPALHQLRLVLEDAHQQGLVDEFEVRPNWLMVRLAHVSHETRQRIFDAFRNALGVHSFIHEEQDPDNSLFGDKTRVRRTMWQRDPRGSWFGQSISDRPVAPLLA